MASPALSSKPGRSRVAATDRFALNAAGAATPVGAVEVIAFPFYAAVVGPMAIYDSLVYVSNHLYWYI